MIEVTLPRSIAVDVCWHQGRVVYAAQAIQMSLLLVVSFNDKLQDSRQLAAFSIAGNAACRVCSHDGVLWLAYRDEDDALHLMRLDTGEVIDLPGSFASQRPLAFGSGFFAWQVGVRTVRVMELGSSPATARTQPFPDNIPTGLWRITADGVVHSWESQRTLHDWAVGFDRSGAFVIGEHFGDRGLVGEIAGQQGRLYIWPDEPMRDPRIAANGGTAAVIAWSPFHSAGLCLVSAEDLVLEAPPEPEPEPEPEPDPMPEPESLLPTVERIYAKYEAAGHLAERGAMLNEIAWEHREDGWGLSAKPSGANAEQPHTGIKIAHDALHHDATGEAQEDGTKGTLFDVLSDSGPIWAHAHPHNQPSRVWVAPVEPLSGEPPEPGEPGEPAESLDDLVQLMIAAAVEPLHKELASLRRRVQVLEEQPAPEPGQPAPSLPTAIALKSAHGKYLVAEPDGRVFANRDGVGAWETWNIEPQE